MDATIFDNIDRNLLDKFKEFHLKNPEIYRAFKMAAYEMRETGREKYSAWTIVNKIRWDWDISNTRDSFKINNDYIALYARLLIYHDPSFKDFFQLRFMKPEDRRDSSEEKYRIDSYLSPN